MYDETQSSRFLYIISAACLLGIGVGAVGFGRKAPEAFIPAAIVLGAVALMLWGFSALRVHVSPTEVVFGFRFWSKRLRSEQIEVGGIAPITLFHGMGIHYVGGLWVYNARLGRGVRLRVGKTNYLIGSDQPERLQSALLQAATRRMPA
jgi:hypothetical protein